jgi:hypothetical protein
MAMSRESDIASSGSIKMRNFFTVCEMFSFSLRSLPESNYFDYFGNGKIIPRKSAPELKHRYPRLGIGIENLRISMYVIYYITHCVFRTSRKKLYLWNPDIVFSTTWRPCEYVRWKNTSAAQRTVFQFLSLNKLGKTKLWLPLQIFTYGDQI